MATTSRATEESTTHAERRAVYEAVLRVVDAQTTPTQPPGVRRTTITRLLSPPNGPHDLGAVRTALQAARENRELLTWPDREGRRRYTVAEADKLRQVAVWEADQPAPRTPIVQWANRMVQEVRDE